MNTFSNIDNYSRTKKRKRKIRQARSRPAMFSGWTNSFNYLEPQREELVSTGLTYVEQFTIASDGLTWSGATPEQLKFIKKVYDVNLDRLSGRSFVNDVPESELKIVEGRYKLRTNAASSAIDMLKAARAAITAAGKNVDVGLNSAYRSASHQFTLWNNYVTNQYYPDTKKQRQELEGGVHGTKAAEYLASFTRGRIGSPGYSNHNNGLAIDLRNTEDGKTLRNRTKKAATDAWRKSWLWSWLVANAATYHFYQNTKIDEPWHWEYRAPKS